MTYTHMTFSQLLVMRYLKKGYQIITKESRKVLVDSKGEDLLPIKDSTIRSLLRKGLIKENGALADG